MAFQNLTKSLELIQLNLILMKLSVLNVSMKLIEILGQTSTHLANPQTITMLPGEYVR